jgi:hypothetical protein
MRPDVQILLSGSLTFGVPLILAVRELVVLRRGGGPGWRPDDHREPDPMPLLPPELPACLRPPFPDMVQEPEWAPRQLELV